MFKLIKENCETEYTKLRVASQAYAKGDLLMLDRTNDAVDVVPATTSATTFGIYAVAMEDVPATATEVLACVITPEQVWEADGSTNSTTNDNMKRFEVATVATVANDGTDLTDETGVFMQTGVIGLTTAKKVVGKFLKVANVTA